MVAWSDIWGTHLGLTNAVASIRLRPASAREVIRRSFRGVGIGVASFWSPSLGPTRLREGLREGSREGLREGVVREEDTDDKW